MTFDAGAENITHALPYYRILTLHEINANR